MGTLRKLSIKIIVLKRWTNLIIFSSICKYYLKMPRKDPVFYFSSLTIPGRRFRNGNLSIFVCIVCTGTCSHRCSIFTPRKEECFKPTSADYNMMTILKSHSLLLPMQVLLNGSRYSLGISGLEPSFRWASSKVLLPSTTIGQRCSAGCQKIANYLKTFLG